ncbi:GNAT family N-acetyltransferase [uncultured Pseudoflavonifractor sp.]|uniref:GNAT family N-acetyltransferase n=1 Tax=uncultured Pseudoflavonifractor sp. TaxID=1221379 RepID=UPI0025DD2DA0|nr:GNAT family N-acetyltransferase [uncultured Pseudoflavonifractor sp.]
MHTARLRIRRFQADDLDALSDLLSDKEVMKYLEAPYTREAAIAFLRRCGMADPPQVYAVEDCRQAFIGYVIYHPYDTASYEIGWVLRKSQWHKGYASELTEALIKDARNRTDHLIIECLPSQTATKKIAEKHHFSFVENRDGLDVYMLCLNGKS